jgi:hypothetical protein
MKPIFRAGLTAIVASLAFPAAGADSKCTLSAYTAPSGACELLKKGDVSLAGGERIEGLIGEFRNCDLHNRFHGIELTGHYRCMNPADDRKSDLNKVAQLAILKGGYAYWDSKMAVDVDGSWASTHGHPGPTDSPDTSFRWPGGASVDPDVYPYIAIPGADPMIPKGSPDKGKWTEEFQNATKVGPGDMGIVIYGGKWTPVFVADIGPINRLGEASSAVHKAVWKDRCAKKAPDGEHCASYIDSGVDGKVVYVVVPNSRDPKMTPDNAIDLMCAFAKEKFKLSGGATCKP